MYDQILFPTDGSEPADTVLDYALKIASEHEATIHILNVADTSQDSLVRIRGDVIDILEQEGEEVVENHHRLQQAVGHRLYRHADARLTWPSAIPPRECNRTGH